MIFIQITNKFGYAEINLFFHQNIGRTSKLCIFPILLSFSLLEKVTSKIHTALL